MGDITVILLQSDSYEALLHGTLLAVTAAAAGDDVFVMPFFGPLQRLARGTLDEAPALDPELPSRRATLKLPAPSALLAQARELGAKLVVCDTHIQLCGEPASSLSGKVDEIVGLTTFWKRTRGGRVVTT